MIPPGHPYWAAALIRVADRMRAALADDHPDAREYDSVRVMVDAAPRSTARDDEPTGRHDV